MNSNKFIALISASDDLRYQYMLRDEFITDLAAGAVNGTAAEPGPGMRKVEDSASKLSISGGNLIVSDGTFSFEDQSLHYPQMSNAKGRTMIVDFTLHHLTGYTYIGFDEGNAGYPTPEMVSIGGGYFDMSGLPGNFPTSLGRFKLAQIVCEGIYHGVIKDASGKWTYLGSKRNYTLESFYPSIQNHSGILDVHSISVCDLPAPWNDEYGFATQRLAGARVQGDVFLHEADCLIEWTISTLASAGASYISFRRTDANNCWAFVWDSDGSGYLSELVDGSPVARASVGAGTIQNGHRVVAMLDGNTIKIYTNNVLRITYSLATNFQDATSGGLDAIGTGGAVSDLVSWPRYISGAALAALNRA